MGGFSRGHPESDDSRLLLCSWEFGFLSEAVGGGEASEPPSAVARNVHWEDDCGLDSELVPEAVQRSMQRDEKAAAVERGEGPFSGTGVCPGCPRRGSCLEVSAGRGTRLGSGQGGAVSCWALQEQGELGCARVRHRCSPGVHTAPVSSGLCFAV